MTDREALHQRYHEWHGSECKSTCPYRARPEYQEIANPKRLVALMKITRVLR